MWVPKKVRNVNISMFPQINVGFDKIWQGIGSCIWWGSSGLTPRSLGDFKSMISKHMSRTKFREYSLWNCPHANATEHLRLFVHIGWSNGLVPSGNKSLPELMLTQIYVIIWHYYRPHWVKFRASMLHNMFAFTYANGSVLLKRQCMSVQNPKENA